MRLDSRAFNEGEPIPKKYTEDGTNVSPPLIWQDVPAGTVEFALIMEDPDAPSSKPWVHWVVIGIPGSARRIPEGYGHEATLSDPDGAVQGLNSWKQNNLGYRGPAPPKGHGRHRYYFRLYALGASLNIAGHVDKQTVMDALRGVKVLAEAQLMGTYER